MDLKRFLLLSLLALVILLSFFQLYTTNFLKSSVPVNCQQNENTIPVIPTDQTEADFFRERNYTDGTLDICDIVFGVLTYSNNRQRMKDLDLTWGRLICRKEKNLFFMSNEDGVSPYGYPIFKSECNEDMNVGLCCKTMKLMKRLYELWPEKKWFFRSDDDTLVIPETLRRMLEPLDPDIPYFIGSRLYIIWDDPSTAGSLVPWKGDISKNLQYASGGGGMAFSRGLMKKAHTNLDKFVKYCQSSLPYEDVVMGQFLKKEHNTTLTNGLGFSYTIIPKGTPITFHLKETQTWRYQLDLMYNILYDRYWVEKN